ncbi:MAG: PASTA domain-containing protein, partial [Streptococcaceae bacterium]|nr:PASTA domain-containing protein [Streptococcaceae bacterium]
VYKQVPEPGSNVSLSDGKITLVIAKKTTKIRDVIGYTKKEVQDYFDSIGVDVYISEQFSDTGKEGTVISTEPGVGASVKKGDTINVTISKGKDPASETGDTIQIPVNFNKAGDFIISVTDDAGEKENSYSVQKGETKQLTLSLAGDRSATVTVKSASGDVIATKKVDKSTESIEIN